MARATHPCPTIGARSHAYDSEAGVSMSTPNALLFPGSSLGWIPPPPRDGAAPVQGMNRGKPDSKCVLIANAVQRDDVSPAEIVRVADAFETACCITGASETVFGGTGAAFMAPGYGLGMVQMPAPVRVIALSELRGGSIFMNADGGPPSVSPAESVHTRTRRGDHAPARVTCLLPRMRCLDTDPARNDRVSSLWV